MSYKRISPQPVVEGGTGAQTLTAHGVVIGEGTSALAAVAPSATVGVPLISAGASADPAYGTGFKIDSSGRTTNANQPLFIVVNNADQTNVTGDGTDYTVTFADSIVNVGSSFDGTSTFTAPVTGNYLFTCNLTLVGLDAAMTNNLFFLVTTGATYRFSQAAWFVDSVAGGTLIISGTCIANMAATDTAVIHVRSIGSGKTVSVVGATNNGYRSPFFSGVLLS